MSKMTLHAFRHWKSQKVPTGKFQVTLVSLLTRIPSIYIYRMSTKMS